MPYRPIPLLLLLCAAASPAHGQIKPPSLKAVKPPFITAGDSVTITLEGDDLDGATEILIGDARGVLVRLPVSSSGPNKAEARFAPPVDVSPGPVAVRVAAKRGLSNEGRLFVSRPGRVESEMEPNDGFLKLRPVSTPCLIDGRIAHGMEVDVFVVDMKAGETLAAEVIASRAGSTLDPLLTIYTADGRELATCDDLFGSDAAAWVQIPRAGRYFVSVADADGTQRDGNIESKLKDNRFYRLALGAIPLLTAVDPPGVRRGTSARLRLLGANVPAETTIDLPPDTPLGERLFHVGGSNSALLRVGDAPELAEAEPNDDPAKAVAVPAPGAVNGRFERKPDGDVDSFKITPADARAGLYTITVHAARIGSPADPVLTVLGDETKTLAEDDDALGRDARMIRQIEPSGLLMSVREFYGRGGDRFLYRVEVEPAAPLAISIDPGTRSLPKDGRVALPVQLDRRGFAEAVAIDPGPLPPGVSSPGLTIPAGQSRGLLLLAIAETATPGAFALRPTLRGTPTQAEWTWKPPADFKPAVTPLPDPTPAALLAVSEPAPLAVRIATESLSLAPGAEAELKVHFERRTEAAKTKLKVGLRPLDGDGGSLDFPAEVVLPADASESILRLKAKPGATPAKLSLIALARFESSAEAQAIASAPCGIEITPGPKPAP